MEGGDFWELPLTNGSGTSSLCLPPQEVAHVVRLLQHRGVPVQVGSFFAVTTMKGKAAAKTG